MGRRRHKQQMYGDISGIPAAERPRDLTALHFWLIDQGLSRWALAKALGVAAHLVDRWAAGQTIPTLVNAFRIERFTGGAVPASSWLGTELARRAWKNLGTVDWESYLAANPWIKARFKDA